MCILFIALKQHPKYPVIICANRDEFHSRPTQSLHVWPNHSILAGKDLQAGGTWLGLTQSGHFSALTNFRQPHLIDNTKVSRGDLVLKALSTENISSNNLTIENHLNKNSHLYNGFNLIYGNLDKLFCFDSVNNQQHSMSDGVYSICNGALTDSWPKMTLGEQQLAQLIEDEHDELDHSVLMNMMMNNTQAIDQTLPKTGLPLDKEKLLSSIFIQSANYGTRSTLVITKDINGVINITEATYSPSGERERKPTKTVASLFDNVAKN